MPTTPPQSAESDGVRPPYHIAAVTGVPSASSGHCSAIPDTVATLWEPAAHCAGVPDTAFATVLPTPRTLLVLSPLQNPRWAWAQPSDGVRTLTKERSPPAGPSTRRHDKHGGRYPPQRPLRRPQEPPGRRHDPRKTKELPRTTATPDTTLSSTPQCTSNSDHPLLPPDSGRRRRLLISPYMYPTHPCANKRRRQASPPAQKNQLIP